MSFRFLLAAFFFFQGILASCGPPQCYKGCTDARPKVDFVFLIDASGSMKPVITGVKNGLTKFAEDLNVNQIDPQFALVRFGFDDDNQYAKLESNLGGIENFKKAMDTISNPSGYWEAGLESLSMILGTATITTFSVNWRSSQNSKRVIILATDEDSDPALYSKNRYGQDSSRDWLCLKDTTIKASDWASKYQPEINSVASNLISVGASLYMFVATPDSGSSSLSQYCNTNYQYCNPKLQSQNPDYSGFNKTVTLAQLGNQSPSQRYSLQGQLLDGGMTSRCFDVVQAKNSDLIKNFFATIVSDVSQCDACYDYPCSGSSCQTPVNQCDCAGVKYGNNTRDSQGTCCRPEDLDCAGVCNGGAYYDSKCKVCTKDGTTAADSSVLLSSICLKDCNNNDYLKLPPNPTSSLTYANIKYQTTCPDTAGYLLRNTDLIKANIVTDSAVCAHYSTYGRFEGRSYCTMNTTAYSAQYGVSPSNAASDWLSKLASSPSLRANSDSNPIAFCSPGTIKMFPPLTKDNCDQCIITLDNPLPCTRDCNGNWYTPGNALHFVDNCGICVTTGTNPDGNKDACDVCFGGNKLKNECNVCANGPEGVDGCGQFVCEQKLCNKECDGNSYSTPTMKLDTCGFCVTIADGISPNCVPDCKGQYYNLTANNPANHRDECNNCIPSAQVRLPSCVQDCNNTWGGSAFVDSCGQCVVNNSPAHQCLQDCNGDYYLSNQTAPHSVDDCGICNTPQDYNSNKDSCGVCKNKAGYDSTSECTADCKGVHSLITSAGRAFNDSCGDCWFANQTEMTNYFMDDCGICHSVFNGTDWNKSTGRTDSKGRICACDTSPTPCPDSSETCFDDCPTYRYCPGTNTTLPDSCGRCPGNSKYDSGKDDCGVCCDPDNGIPCNQDKDDCGVCFGLNIGKNNCGFCSGSCIKDCNNVWGGNAVVGCDGVCNSNASCCGDGMIQAGEACDNNSTTCVNCQVVAGQSNTGKVIGGVIGGVAAVGFLVLAALLAVKYAQKAGLIGSANKQVDMGASNSNPLYKSEVAVHQNPLYETS